MQHTHAHEHKYWAVGSGENDETCEKRERSRSPRAASDADKYMKDSEKFYKAYKKRGGKCSFDAFSELLRAFY